MSDWSHRDTGLVLAKGRVEMAGGEIEEERGAGSPMGFPCQLGHCLLISGM